MKAPYRITEKEDVYKNAKVKFMPDGFCRVTAFNRGVYKGEFYEPIKMRSFEIDKAEVLTAEREYLERLNSDRVSDSERVRSDSFKRAKDKIFEIAAANDWSYMVTLTLDKDKIDRYDKDVVKNTVGKWLDNMVQRKGLIALLVPEHHKDGAIHFHGLVNDTLTFTPSGNYKIKGKKGTVKLSTLRKKGKNITDSDVQEVFNIKEYKLGFSTAVKLDGNVTAVSYYMTKYCTKDLKKIFGSYYIAVGKIKRQLPYQICNMDFEQIRQAPNSKIVDLPERLGQVAYITITKDDFEGLEIL